ncbi:hypothetical protein IW146_000020 [Coemansia sp. RSA 922]|nr:hypothetical protein H4S03_006799 [Coemansia sp. S3946]KAJ2055185.1 hypothetical protein GGI08_004230 [Coemansia sp. S2]KAJ2118314.1 hypothetical protein IW146_000020 [Coemansia sp. RSA 922]
MLAYQQQHQQAGSAAGSSSVVTVPPASVSAAHSKLRFGNTSFASFTAGPPAASAKDVHSGNSAELFHHPFPKSFAAPGSSHKQDVTEGRDHSLGQQGSHGSHRNVNPAFAAPHWQNYHNHYNQHQQKPAQEPAVQPGSIGTGNGNNGRSTRRVPNASDLNKQWRATANAANAAATANALPNAHLSINTGKPSPGSREVATLMSSTYQGGNASPLLSGLSLALNKHKMQNTADTPHFDIPQQRTPHPLSPADSMKTPGYVDPDSLPFALGSDIADPTTGKQYRLLSVLGEGSYAVVYLARCSHDGAKYALKCLSKLGLTSRQLALQRTELEIHGSVCPHPHIVTLFAHFETRDWLFLVMERVSGPDLYDYITQHPAFNANQEERRFVEATRLFEQMIDAVAHIHALKAYHRDLKPENFILGADGNLKLTDFGLATRESLSTDFECGSKPYMSYENRNGGLNPNDPTVYGPREDYSPRLSDVWALGVLFLNLLFAQSPWTDPSRASCFKFCRFLREGAGFLSNQFPKLPREVADFLVTRIFSPESGRCNVLELKQWVQDLDYPFNAPKPPSAFASRSKNAAPNRRPINAAGAATAGSFVGSYGKSLTGGVGSKKWSPPSNGIPHAMPRLQHVPQPVLATTALALDSATAASSPTKAKPPHAKRFTAINQYKLSGATAKHNLSTSVPALVFSQIIPATQAAAARKMMPREFNHTAAKAAAAILQSSMLCLPKNGLGQGKQDDGEDIMHADAREYYDDDGDTEPWNQLENVSEVEDEDEAAGLSNGGLASVPEYTVAASTMASKFPKHAIASSLGFGIPKAGAHMYDSEEDMDFSEPLSFDDSQRLPVLSAGAKSLPATSSRLHASATSAVVPKRPLHVAVAVPAISSSSSESSLYSDGFDILGHFSEEESNVNTGSTTLRSPISSKGAVVGQSSSRARFGDARLPVPSVVPLARGVRPDAANTSADSSLTATLVTSSVEYYSPRMMPVSDAGSAVHTPPLNGSAAATPARSKRTAAAANYADDVEADDEADASRWSHRIGSASVKSSAPTSAAANPRSARSVRFSNHLHTVHHHSSHPRHDYNSNNNSDSRRPGNPAFRQPLKVTAIALPQSMARPSNMKPAAMHSLPAPIKKLGNQSLLDSDAHTSFSWADDVEELPIPSLASKLGAASISRQTNNHLHYNTNNDDDDDALSDELSWSIDEDRNQQSDDMFAMEL